MYTNTIIKTPASEMTANILVLTYFASVRIHNSPCMELWDMRSTERANWHAYIDWNHTLARLTEHRIKIRAIKQLTLNWVGAFNADKFDSRCILK